MWLYRMNHTVIPPEGTIKIFAALFHFPSFIANVAGAL